MVVAVPFATGVALVAEPMIRLAFGPDWAAAAPPLRILCLYGIFAASAQFCWPLLISVGEPRRFALIQLVTLIFGAPAIWWASVNYGLEGTAWAMAAMGGLFAVLIMLSTLSLIGDDVSSVLQWAPRSLAAALVMTLVVEGAQLAIPYDGTAGLAAIHLGMSVVLGAVTYPLALLLLWRLAGRPEGAESRMLKMVGGMLPGRLRRA